MQSTTIRIKRSTLRMLESYKDQFNADSLDEVIRKLIIEYRKTLLGKYYGIDQGKISSFTEADRVEDRNF